MSDPNLDARLHDGDLKKINWQLVTAVWLNDDVHSFWSCFFVTDYPHLDFGCSESGLAGTFPDRIVSHHGVVAGSAPVKKEVVIEYKEVIDQAPDEIHEMLYWLPILRTMLSRADMYVEMVDDVGENRLLSTEYYEQNAEGISESLRNLKARYLERLGTLVDAWLTKQSDTS